MSQYAAGVPGKGGQRYYAVDCHKHFGDVNSHAAPCDTREEVIATIKGYLRQQGQTYDAILARVVKLERKDVAFENTTALDLTLDFFLSQDRKEPPMPLTTDTQRRILDLSRDGKSQRQIAAELQVSRLHVREALAKGNAAGAPSPDVREISLDLLLDNPWQAEGRLAQADIEPLADSIRALGLLQLPLARPAPADVSLASGLTYQLAFGHRRRNAVALLLTRGQWPRPTMPVDVRELSDKEMALASNAENGDRLDVNPLARIRAWRKMLDEIPGLTIAEIARGNELARTTISNYLRLLTLPQAVLDHIASGELSPRAAREFLCLMNEHHTHEAEIANVLSMCERRDAWGLQAVRAALVTVCSHWHSAHRTLSAPFSQAHPSLVHLLPTGPGDQTEPYICDAVALVAWLKARWPAPAPTPPGPLSEADEQAKYDRGREYRKLNADIDTWIAVKTPVARVHLWKEAAGLKKHLGLVALTVPEIEAAIRGKVVRYEALLDAGGGPPTPVGAQPSGRAPLPDVPTPPVYKTLEGVVQAMSAELGGCQHAELMAPQGPLDLQKLLRDLNGKRARVTVQELQLDA